MCGDGCTVRLAACGAEVAARDLDVTVSAVCVHTSTITVAPTGCNTCYSLFMDILNDLTEASNKLRQLDQRRQNQQAYRDELIRQAKEAGHGWTAILKATGMQPRSLTLAIRRITNPRS